GTGPGAEVIAGWMWCDLTGLCRLHTRYHRRVARRHSRVTSKKYPDNPIFEKNKPKTGVF
ncbi:MAG: hypothetical protein V4764_22365, partial [Burkholderia sp.]